MLFFCPLGLRRFIFCCYNRYDLIYFIYLDHLCRKPVCKVVFVVHTWGLGKFLLSVLKTLWAHIYARPYTRCDFNLFSVDIYQESLWLALRSGVHWAWSEPWVHSEWRLFQDQNPFDSGGWTLIILFLWSWIVCCLLHLSHVLLLWSFYF